MQLREERFLQRYGMADHKPCPMTRMSSFNLSKTKGIVLWLSYQHSGHGFGAKLGLVHKCAQ